ncbi:MAG TPA: isoprenylcysteine carboxylmethyltransferase family protein [Polyangia bacterium]|nr:isoprenylcysteine carboxylmethyltransferase family protein [Polyangia bacterium]
MPASTFAFLVLLAAVGLGRLLEMRLSRRHQRSLAALGAQPAADPIFPAMVALHAGVLVASALEVVWLHRPFTPAVGVPALVAFALANGLRWWVIATLGPHWNVRVVSSLTLGVVTAGPYRFVRHPNYVAVFVELLALPLVHGAWVTALVGGALHAVVLRRRVAAEEAVLAADAAYGDAMGRKPRFVPRLGRPRAGAATWPTS